MAYTQFIYFFTLILSLFTIFFILLYFNTRSESQKNADLCLSIKILRHQNLVKQQYFSSMIRSFLVNSRKLDKLSHKLSNSKSHSLAPKFKVKEEKEKVIKRINPDLLCSKKEVFQYLAILVKFY